MITISDLNTSRKNCFTELKYSEMMGHILGGFSLKFGVPYTFGNRLIFDQNNDGTITLNEVYTPFSGTLEFTLTFEKENEVQSHPDSMDDCP
ncbi:hypothetical protein [Moorena sp. SIO4A5]|uniref:hypothetical protein n=1 Tax=Moorena sp. SIO4A5 TaxID=2607838 RepID=UPI0013C5A526|nr:hypothetical protein [Moorena sp. SIO4A5]NEO24143.1 hypothetical protein [Moorena sp. SIO4A5]